MPRKRETAQQRWAKKNRDKLQAACRRWRARHPERQKAATYRWRRKNLAKWNAYQRRWRKRNPKLVRAATRRRWQKLKRDRVRYAKHLAAGRMWAARHPEFRGRRANSYRRENREKIRKYARRWMKRWYRTHRKEARKQKKLYRLSNIEKWRAWYRMYYRTRLRNNPLWRTRKRRQGRLWIKRNSMKQRQRVAVYRARKIAAKGSHTLEQWMGVVRRHSWKCFYCGKRLNLKTLTKDHRNPLSTGGTDFVRNLVPACKSCNSGKAGRRQYRVRRKQ